ncbi:hypothetical protein CEP52_014544 [Fusarium oligoseptatum]|uniref:Uncharacterized protein n=1 Tax=Fusarium oligoseptatum TaxID=2604345 RepID=A0A428SLB8_9HYPO|nr:hypothetical protein CEP52_014544 [Fusarium oligoseptatum]
MEPARKYYIVNIATAQHFPSGPSIGPQSPSLKRFRAASPHYSRALQALHRARLPASFSGFSGRQPL